jgi:hypothetical protein
LEVIVEYEELPVVWLHAESWEDEQRLRQWLLAQQTRDRLGAAIFDALEEAA